MVDDEHSAYNVHYKREVLSFEYGHEQGFLWIPATYRKSSVHRLRVIWQYRIRYYRWLLIYRERIFGSRRHGCANIVGNDSKRLGVCVSLEPSVMGGSERA